MMSQTLLLADDSTTMQRVVELTFAEQGVTVVSVSDGQEAVDYITSQRPSLALVSATLPKMNGFEVARFVRDHAERRVPVLLLAGAFDNLDESRVRESGASGVLVKPFEPAVVIKRVKELLGLKPESPSSPLPPRVRSADTGSGRLVTTSEGPKREPIARQPSETGVKRAMEDTPGQSPDYLAQLDAAFDSLDAQLAARPAPAARAATPAPLPSLPGALDPSRRPAPPAEASSGSGPAPVFEVDDNWFDKKPVAAESLSGLTEFVVTRATDFAPPPAPATEADRSWAPPAVHSESTPVSVPTATDVAVPATPQTTIANSAAPPGDLGTRPNAPSSATVAPGGPSTTTSSNHTALSDDSIERLTAQLTERVAARVGAPLADRLASDLPSRLTQDLAVQIVDAVADRVMAHLEPRLVDQLVTRVVSDLTPRVADAVGTRVVNELVPRLGASLAEGLSSSIAERVGSGLAEQIAQHTLAGALGENLRQTVHDVAERIVRAEVDRIKAAAESRRAS